MEGTECAHNFTTNSDVDMSYYLLGKGSYSLAALVCLSVCPFVSNITQKLINGL